MNIALFLIDLHYLTEAHYIFSKNGGSMNKRFFKMFGDVCKRPSVSL